MKILLVGGHQKANYLAKLLVAKKHNVTVINDNYEWCLFLANIHKITCIHGDGTKPYILADAQAQVMNTVIALSNKDSTNLVVCELAKKQFGVKNTLAIVNDPKNAGLFQQLGVTKCISATQMIAEIIEQEAVVHALKQFLPLENGKVSLCELQMDSKCPAAGREIQQLGLPAESNVSCVIRGEDTIIAKGNTRLYEGDKILLLARPDAMQKAIMLITGR